MFDIDKTLVARSGAHLKAFFSALREVYGMDPQPNVITHHGMTDQQIIREILKTKGVAQSEADAGIRRCMEIMVARFDEFNVTDVVTLLPGVEALLAELARRAAFLGLVTGNLEHIAWKKLAKAGIDRYFSFGGFGSDDIDRRKMAALAVQRCNSMYPASAGCRIALFGDTPYDVAAGKHIGALSVGVCTGYPTRKQLADAGADIVLEDLADTAGIIKIILEK